jgi:hypothetical protein
MIFAPTPRALVLPVLALLFPAVVSAQEFGLDLTTDTADLRPTLAVLGVNVPEEMSKERAVQDWINATLVSVAQKSLHFASVLQPGEAAAALADKYALAQQCTEDACMAEIAATLGVERVLTSQLVREGSKTALQLNAFTRATLEVKAASVEGKGPPRADFMKKVVLAERPLLQALSGKLAQLKIAPSAPEAAVTLGDRELGKGPVDVKVSAGTYALKVTAAGHRVHQQQLTLEEGGKTELEVALEKSRAERPASDTPVAAAVPVPPPPPSRPRADPFTLPPVLTHPGTYVGVAGGLATVVGMTMGLSAVAANDRGRDTDGDGIRNITRAEALAARSGAATANVLMATGLAALAGGSAWLLLQPPRGGGAGVAAGGKF